MNAEKINAAIRTSFEEQLIAAAFMAPPMYQLQFAREGCRRLLTDNLQGAGIVVEYLADKLNPTKRTEALVLPQGGLVLPLKETSRYVIGNWIDRGVSRRADLSRILSEYPESETRFWILVFNGIYATSPQWQNFGFEFEHIVERLDRRHGIGWRTNIPELIKYAQK